MILCQPTLEVLKLPIELENECQLMMIQVRETRNYNKFPVTYTG